MSIVNELPKIALVMLVLGSVGAFASQNLETQSPATPEIRNEKDLKRLIFYDSLIAYNCDSDGGGGDVMPSWQEFYRSNKAYFDVLKQRGFNLRCKGTEVTSPLSGSPVENWVPGVKKEWRNDQEGRDSRKKFTVNTGKNGPEYFDFSGKPFYLEAPSGDEQNLVFYAQGPGEVSRFSGDISEDRIKKDPFYSGDYDGPVGKNTGTVTFILPEEFYGKNGETINYQNPQEFKDLLSEGRPLPVDVPGYDIRICDGAEGYVQTNTGPPGEPPYSASDRPGKHMERGKGDNWLHVFVVIQKTGCTGDVPRIGLERGEVISYKEAKWRGERLDLSLTFSGLSDSLLGSKQFNPDSGSISEEPIRISQFHLASDDDFKSRCGVRVSDGQIWDQGSSSTVLFEEGHLITQEGPVAGELERVNLANDNTWQKSDVIGDDEHTGQLVFSKFDPAKVEESRRRRSKGNSELALERYYPKDDGSLRPDRFVARPEGDLLCADYGGGPSREVQWVKCGEGFLQRSDSDSLSAGGKTYSCEVSDSYEEDGKAQWVPK